MTMARLTIETRTFNNQQTGEIKKYIFIGIRAESPNMNGNYEEINLKGLDANTKKALNYMYEADREFNPEPLNNKDETFFENMKNDDNNKIDLED